jgi:hypothetical protein
MASLTHGFLAGAYVDFIGRSIDKGQQIPMPQSISAAKIIGSRNIEVIVYEWNFPLQQKIRMSLVSFLGAYQLRNRLFP